MNPIYQKIGSGYSATRRSDSRIVDRIVELLDLAPGSRVLDVGAGTGSYASALTKRGYQVTALEPSSVMREQAEEDSSVSWVEGSAESLPFADDSFDAAILILCVHHFTDLPAAFAEVRRVVPVGPVVIFTYDPAAIENPWLFQYFPIFREQIQSSFPQMELIRSFIRDCFAGAAWRRLIRSSPISSSYDHDLSDGFAGAAWRYPERYLEQEYQPRWHVGLSTTRKRSPLSPLEEGLAKLASEPTVGEVVSGILVTGIFGQRAPMIMVTPLSFPEARESQQRKFH